MHQVIVGITVVSFVLLVLRGAFRGFSGELAHLAGLCACIGAIWFGFDPVQRSFAYLPQLDAQAASFYATLTIFIIGAVLFFIIAKVVGCIASLIIPQPFNAILGAIIGGAKAVLFISIITGTVMLIHDKVTSGIPYDKETPSAKVLITCWEKILLPGFMSSTDELKRAQEENDGGR